MALWEVVAPRRALTVSKVLRWRSKLGLVVLVTELLRLMFGNGVLEGHGSAERTASAVPSGAL